MPPSQEEQESSTQKNAENLVYQPEKSHKDLGDQVSASEKAPIEEQLNKLKETLKGSDTDAIKADTDELTKRFYSIAEKLYQNAAPQGDASQQQTSAGPQQGPDGSTVYDADYKVVDDDDKKDKGNK